MTLSSTSITSTGYGYTKPWLPPHTAGIPTCSGLKSRLGFNKPPRATLDGSSEVVGQTAHGRPIFLLIIGAKMVIYTNDQDFVRRCTTPPSGPALCQRCSPSQGGLRNLPMATQPRRNISKHTPLMSCRALPQRRRRDDRGIAVYSLNTTSAAEWGSTNWPGPWRHDGRWRGSMDAMATPAGPLWWMMIIPTLCASTVDDDPSDAYVLCQEGSFVNWDGNA